MKQNEKEPLDATIEEIEDIIVHIAISRLEENSSLKTSYKYDNTLKHLQSIGYDINELGNNKIIITW
jgi:hypothetical protein